MNSLCIVTDDELLAVAFLVGGEWKRPLETVQLGDVSQAAAAIQRGIRSLRLREILAADGETLSQDVDPAVTAVTAPVRLVVASVDEHLNAAAGPERFEVSGAGEEWVVNAVEVGGVHRIVRVPRDEAQGFVIALLISRSQVQDELGLCLLVRNDDGRLAGGLHAHDGVVRLLTTQPDGSLEVGEPQMVDAVSISAAVDAMSTSA